MRTLYLDHASTSWPKPPAVREAVAQALEMELGGPGRGGHTAARAAEHLRKQTRRRLAERLGLVGGVPIFTSGATAALNLALLGLCTPRALGTEPPRRVLVSPREHNAVTRPLAWLVARGWATVEPLPVDDAGRVDARAAGELAAGRPTTPPAALCVCTAADNVTGLIQPLPALARALHEHAPRTLLLVDASQAAGLLSLCPPDAPRPDLIAFGAHKTLRGPAGLGVLDVGPRAFDPQGDPDEQPLQPVAFGGTGATGGDEPIAPARAPARFEPGTPPVPLFAGLLAALDHLPEAALTHERAWLARAIAGTRGWPAVRWVGSAGRCAERDDPSELHQSVGVAAFRLEHDAWTPDTLAAALDASFGIRVRAGFHCAPSLHDAIGTRAAGGLVRLSPGPDATGEDADRFLHALAELLSA